MHGHRSLWQWLEFEDCATSFGGSAVGFVRILDECACIRTGSCSCCLSLEILVEPRQISDGHAAGLHESISAWAFTEPSGSTRTHEALNTTIQHEARLIDRPWEKPCAVQCLIEHRAKEFIWKIWWLC